MISISFNPGQRGYHSHIRTIRRGIVAKHIPIKPAFFHPVDPVHRVPMPFLVRDNKCPIRIEAYSICRSKSGGYDLGLQSVFTHLDQGSMLGYQCLSCMSGTFGIIKVPFFIRLKSHGKLMEVVCDLVVIVETFVKVRFSISI